MRGLLHYASINILKLNTIKYDSKLNKQFIKLYDYVLEN